MQIILKNVGCIKKAAVNLTGLNVIAGPNGTGKSTVGKTVYTIIKSISNYKNNVRTNKKNLLESMRQTLFFSIQNNLQKANATDRNHDVKILLGYFDDSFSKQLIDSLQDVNNDVARNAIIERIKLIDTFITLDEKTKLSSKKALNDMMDVVADTSESEGIKYSLESMYHEIFSAQVNNIHTHETSEVTLDNNGDILLKYTVSNNATVLPFSDRLSLHMVPELTQRIFPEVTFIETPFILQARQSDNIPYYWRDLLDKLQGNDHKVSSQSAVYKDLSDMLRGELMYIPDKQDFFFVPANTDNNLYVANMASGEKSFGILQRLAKFGYLNSAHMFIFDEPENHLHPQWQVKLAKLLVTLLKNNVSVLLTTHSATLINALQDFAYHEGLTDKMHFYFANQEGEINAVESYENKGDVIFQSFYDSKKELPPVL